MAPPSGQDSLAVREAYLRQRQQRRGISDRGWTLVWVALAAVIAWVFVAAFAGLNH